MKGESGPSTSLCANGTVVDLSLPTQFLVDEDGRWSDDDIASGGVDRCG
jgi:hypothetical protein